MKESKFSFTGKDGIKIIGYKWLPEDGEIKGVLQIIHGSIEHAKRYKDYAHWLTEKNIAVYTHDQRGHGETAGKVENLAFFSKEQNGWKMAIDEIYEVTKLIKEDLPNIPIFLLGHSMGSIEALHFAELYGTKINGLLVSGSPANSTSLKIQTSTLVKALKLSMSIKGRDHRSKLVHNIVYKGLSLSRDEKIEQEYLADPYCGTLCTMEYIHEMLSGSCFINRKEHLRNIPKQLPIYFFAGEKDPIGGAKSIPLFDSYKKAGVENVSYKLYQGALHETLNEINKEEVYLDTFNWMNNQLGL